MLAYLGKILLFLAGMLIVLDVIDMRKLEKRGEGARERLEDLRRQQERIVEAKSLEVVAESMARHATTREPLPEASLADGFLTADEFATWADAARAETIAAGDDPDKFPEVSLNQFEKSARSFLLRNERIPEAQRVGLKIIHKDHEERGWRHSKAGIALIVIMPPVAVAVVCVSGERHPVMLGLALFLGGAVALYIWGALLQPAVLRGFRRATASRRSFLAWSVWKFTIEAKGRKLLTKYALIAYLTGSLIDLATSLP